MVKFLTYGGAERVAVSWGNGLSKLGHEVAILTDLESPITYRPSDGIKLIQVNKIHSNTTKGIYGIINRIKRFVSNTKHLLGIMKDYKPDVIINVLYMNAHQLLIAKLLNSKRIPIIMTDHNSYQWPQNVKPSFSQWCNKFIDNRFFERVTVLTHADKKILEKKGFKNVRVLHNPLFLEPITKHTAKKNIVLAIGRMDAWKIKGFDVLVRAWKTVYATHPNWRLVIKGKFVPEVISMLKEIGGDSVESIDFLDYDENVLDAYREASIFVLSSRYEGWGLVAVEAMSQGCATIACDFNGRQAEFIEDNVNGLLCEPDNHVMLSQKICYLINNPQIIERFQREAPISVTRFNEITVAEEMLSIINEVK